MMSNRYSTCQLLCAACIGLFLASESHSESSTTASSWVDIDGVEYGAKPDERGPIGGGSGYTDIVSAGDFTVRTVDQLLDALKQAKRGDVVYLPGDVEMNLTALVYIDRLVIEIPAGVTLASNRGEQGSQGALLVCDALDTPGVLRPMGPEARVAGLRLQGPNNRRYLDHHKRSFGKGGKGRDYYYKLPTSQGIVCDVPKLTVDNCEISGFSHAGIYLRGGDGHYIHHNYIHHCQYNGLGYGVCHADAQSVIEYNLFNWNRHSIAGTGQPGCSYTARHNVELGESLSHCFDMHGGRDRNDGTNIAGTTIRIENNTFGAARLPIKIRGVPEQRCDVTKNWFPNHRSPSDAVVAGNKTYASDNACGAQPEVR